MPSVEEKVEEYFKRELDACGLRYYGKTEKVNDAIAGALSSANSKSGGSGKNFPDIQLLADDGKSRRIPVMVEAKGGKGKLEKLSADGEIELESPGRNKNAAVQGYAVNGALHYGNAILESGAYDEVIIIGLNGTTVGDEGKLADPEIKAYYVSKKNACVPKEIKDFNFSSLKPGSIETLYRKLDELALTEKEKEQAKKLSEEGLEKSIKSIHQKIYDDESLRTLLTTNEKLYFFCGLIMAGLTTKGINALHYTDLPGNDNDAYNDGTIIMQRIKAFMAQKHCSEEKQKIVMSNLSPVFSKRDIWRPEGGTSLIRSVYRQVEKKVLPLLESNLHLDFAGRILNSLNDWVSIDNDKLNDVVLTPRFITNLMAKITRTNKDSVVWDTCMGSSGFLISAMDLMISDAKAKISDKGELEEKIKNIYEKQTLGIEILGNLYILAVLNMILMGNGASQLICGDAHKEAKKFIAENADVFKPDVFLLNPPYSAPGRGLVFVDEALSLMEAGYGAVLIQENTGAGQGGTYAKNILKKNRLVASIHMPDNLFGNKATVQTAIYLFQVGQPHRPGDEVLFIDFSNDGYERQNRKKSTQDVNLKDRDHAKERYEEVAALCLGKRPETTYYTEGNGRFVRDTISLEGNDWAFWQHKKEDNIPSEDDFMKTIEEHLTWEIANAY